MSRPVRLSAALAPLSLLPLLAAGRALGALLALELRGMVEALPGKQFRRA